MVHTRFTQPPATPDLDILLTNDDGADAAGLVGRYGELTALGDVTVRRRARPPTASPTDCGGSRRRSTWSSRAVTTVRTRPTTSPAGRPPSASRTRSRRPTASATGTHGGPTAGRRSTGQSASRRCRPTTTTSRVSHWRHSSTPPTARTGRKRRRLLQQRVLSRRTDRRHHPCRPCHRGRPVRRGRHRPASAASSAPCRRRPSPGTG